MKNSEKNVTVIIKKYHKAEGGAHGGAWKVAFADFMTAMMAFFLVMWLISTLTAEKREAIATYMKTHKFSPFSNGGSPIGRVYNPNPISRPITSIAAPDVLKYVFRIMVDKEFKNEKNSISLEQKEKGFLIELFDPDDNVLNSKGVTSLKPLTLRFIKSISKVLVDFDNMITLEGHSDNVILPTTDYSQWELSVGRALAARKEFVTVGMENEKIMMVSGYAAASPLIANVTEEPKNRRISIYISSTKGVDTSDSKILDDLTPHSSSGKVQG